MGVLGATGVGIGAIVGGGILALAGVAFATTGPGAIVAFALNGVIALLTALSFAEMSAAFPESGGTYTFAKKVLSVDAAFGVGWVVWFASIVASLLYALGFGAFAVAAADTLWRAVGGAPPAWLASEWTRVALAIGATGFFTLGLLRHRAGGGQWATIGKVIVFGVILIAGAAALPGRSLASMRQSLTPFFPGGGLGLFQAMGYTFIALQGFDLIAAVAGEVRDPGRNIPRAMLYSLGAALGIYLPLLFLLSTVGVEPGERIADASHGKPETVVALSVEKFLGPVGFWLVLVAGLLSMLSALQANLFAASRVAFAMARDRTLPRRLARLHAARMIPTAAVLASSGAVGLLVLLVHGVAAAGAASSLIFLVSFGLTHWTSILARRRGGAARTPFRVPWFPVVPIVGAVACMTLAVFQAIAVPTAGLVAGVWLGLGAVLFLALFARPARVVDASAQALDPDLVRLRGRSPLVLVPIANPANAEAMVAVAHALAPPVVGRVLLLSVVSVPEEWRAGERPKPLRDAQEVLGEALAASFAAGHAPEALTTIAPARWDEIRRVARVHRCESLLLGLSRLSDEAISPEVETVLEDVDCDVVVLRALAGFRLDGVRRVLVTLGGRGGHDRLRARLLGSLCRTGTREVRFLRIVPGATPPDAVERARRELEIVAQAEVRGDSVVEVVRSDDVAGEVVGRAREADLVVLGLRWVSPRRRGFGDVTVRVARETSCGILMIGRKG